MRARQEQQRKERDREALTTRESTSGTFKSPANWCIFYRIEINYLMAVIATAVCGNDGH